ncbi:porin [Methylonatrum kenyense]|uniref:porin n=1 Tax=Methylonatrum kenyense TaxID=455253 RepID=UPI0020BF8B0D|nr:porin [Methylonatrum kenyense]MCK8517299.1 porin [Methylonatrum kenyense]
MPAFFQCGDSLMIRLARPAPLLAGLSATAILGLPTVGQSVVSDVDWEVYGRLHADLAYLDNGDDYSAFNLASRSSRIGFRIGYDVLPNLRAIGQVERLIAIDSSDSTFPARDTFLGAEGTWGRLRAGRFNTPLKDVQRAVNLFSDQVGDARNILRNNYTDASGVRLQGFDERFRNGINYETPRWQGLGLAAHYSLETEPGGSSANNNANDAWSTALTYVQGGLTLALAHERNNKEDRDLPDRYMTRLGAVLDLNAWRFTGLAQQAGRPDDTAFGLGARYSVTQELRLKTQYYRLDADDTDFDAQMLAVGADYVFNRHFTVYASSALMDNDRLQTLTPWQQGSNIDRGGAADRTGYALALGAMFNF